MQDQDLTLILEDIEKRKALQQFKMELRRQEKIEHYKKKAYKAILVLNITLALIIYAIICMTA